MSVSVRLVTLASGLVPVTVPLPRILRHAPVPPVTATVPV